MKIDTVEKDIRCPVGRKLFMKLLTQYKETKQPLALAVIEGNLMEFHCDLCTKNAKQEDSTVVRVVHRFNIAGDLIETVAKKDQ